MQALNQNTTVKFSIEHNISSMKIIQARFDLNQTILSVKQNIQLRYGSLTPFIRLHLKDTKGKLICSLTQDLKTLGQYGASNDMVLYVQDLNPASILKQIQSYQGVQKYNISQQNYQKLPQNFRKWKKQFILNNPQFIKQNKDKLKNIQEKDHQYLAELASSIEIGMRCKLNNGARGQIKYVGKIMDKGNGYFVGIKLDQPYGDSNGIVKGVKYFDTIDKYAIFARPNAIEVGDFPELDIDDEI